MNDYHLLQKIITPEILYENVIEVTCRVSPVLPSSCHLPSHYWKRNVTGKTNEELHVISELNKSDLIEKLKNLKEKGIKSIAVVLMHSYT